MPNPMDAFKNTLLLEREKMYEDLEHVDFCNNEMLPSNRLISILKDSDLDQTKAKYILENFKDYFDIADEWERKAKTIKVVDENQLTDIKIARTGRLFLREKRIAIEKARKKLKEQSLREGKAIDGIANVLKALIVPIEEYLEKQEKFVEIKESLRIQAIKEEEELKAEQKRIEQEREAQELQKKIEQENLRLRREAAEREKVLEEERRKARAKEAEIKAQAEAKQKRIQAEANRKLREEQTKKEEAQRELFLKREQERKEREEEEKKKEQLLRASDSEKIRHLTTQLKNITIPTVKSKRSIALMEEVRQHLNEIIKSLTLEEDF